MCIELRCESELHLVVGLAPGVHALLLLSRWLRCRPVFRLLLLRLCTFEKAELFLINSALWLDIFKTRFIQHCLILALNPLPVFLYLCLSRLLSRLYHIGSLPMPRYDIGRWLRWCLLHCSFLNKAICAAITIFLSLLLEL